MVLYAPHATTNLPTIEMIVPKLFAKKFITVANFPVTPAESFNPNINS